MLRAILDAANECLGHFDDRPPGERWCDALLQLLDLAAFAADLGAAALPTLARPAASSAGQFSRPAQPAGWAAAAGPGGPAGPVCPDAPGVLRPALRTGASAVAAIAVTPIPAATTAMAAGADSTWSRNPARSEPSGITPHATCRLTLLAGSPGCAAAEPAHPWRRSCGSRYVRTPAHSQTSG